MVEFNSELHDACFPFLAEKEVRALLAVMTNVTTTAGAQLFEKGDSANGMYFLVAGRVAVQDKTGFGDRTQVVALLDPGAPVGEGGLLGNMLRGATLTAVKDSSLIFLSREAFDTVAEENPVLANSMLKFLIKRLSQRLRKSSERLVHVL